MKVLFCYSSQDSISINSFSNFISERDKDIKVIIHTTPDVHWKQNVEKSIHDTSNIVFFISPNSVKSENFKWEFQIAASLNKNIFIIFLESTVRDYSELLMGKKVTIVKNEPIELLYFLGKTQEINTNLLLEQYKIMVSSTEKVTDQRLLVHNLFFTVCATIFSVSFYVVKEMQSNENINNFSIVLFLLVIITMGFIFTRFWEKMINSYGNLNRGKFIIISDIEKQLNTDLFDREWQVLEQKLKYKSNTETELSIIRNFRIFILIIGLLELFYVIIKNWDKFKILLTFM